MVVCYHVSAWDDLRMTERHLIYIRQTFLESILPNEPNENQNEPKRVLADWKKQY